MRVSAASPKIDSSIAATESGWAPRAGGPLIYPPSPILGRAAIEVNTKTAAASDDTTPHWEKCCRAKRPLDENRQQDSAFSPSVAQGHSPSASPLFVIISHCASACEFWEWTWEMWAGRVGLQKRNDAGEMSEFCVEVNK
ncbi:hypothetical protein Ddc_06733 [Ditylenchus destructor]|nr:hypothetical protein Ddc_06733 [Ditylenchus destructor]